MPIIERSCYIYTPGWNISKMFGTVRANVWWNTHIITIVQTATEYESYKCTKLGTLGVPSTFGMTFKKMLISGIILEGVYRHR